MINTVQLNRAFTFPAMTQGSYVVLPKELDGNYNELIFYVLFDHTSDTGKVQMQTAPYREYSGTWAPVGNSVDWAAIDSVKYGAVSGIFGAVRFTLTTAVTTGNASLWVICSNVT